MGRKLVPAPGPGMRDVIAAGPGLDYRRPHEQHKTWKDQQEPQRQAAQPVNRGGEQVITYLTVHNLSKHVT